MNTVSESLSHYDIIKDYRKQLSSRVDSDHSFDSPVYKNQGVREYIEQQFATHMGDYSHLKEIYLYNPFMDLEPTLLQALYNCVPENQEERMFLWGVSPDTMEYIPLPDGAKWKPSQDIVSRRVLYEDDDDLRQKLQDTKREKLAQQISGILSK